MSLLRPEHFIGAPNEIEPNLIEVKEVKEIIAECREVADKPIIESLGETQCTIPKEKVS